MKTELLYLYVENYRWYEKLEISFSNDYEFREKDGVIMATLKNAVNLFDEKILNLTTLVGNNGVGKSTILRTIFHLINTRNIPFTMIFKQEEKIFIHAGENGLKFSQEALELLGEEYGGEQNHTTDMPIQVGIFSHTLDGSLPDFTQIIKNNKHFNFTPTSLISQPNNFLDYSLKSNANLLNNIRTYYVIDKIHQIQFFVEVNFKFLELRKKPNRVVIGFDRLDIAELKGKIIGEFKPILEEISNDHTLMSIVEWQVFVKLHHMYARYRRIMKKEYQKKFEEIYLDLVKKILTAPISHQELENLTTKLVRYFYEIDKDKKEELKKEIENIWEALENLSKMIEGKVDFEFQLDDAADFLKNMLVIVGSIGNDLGNLLPTEITYRANDEQFYFSTGEEQMIRLATYINLACRSIMKSSKNNAPETFLLLIDEPDNGLNPQAQKRVINQLNEYLNEDLKEFKDIFFQVIMTTHSPIITSDLTSNHLRLFEREDEDLHIQAHRHSYGEKQTFAENIYRLYKNAFFINDGLMGKFAEKRLMDLYQYLDEKEADSYYSNYTKEQLSQLISEISDPLIRLKFEEKHSEGNKLQRKVKKILGKQLTEDKLKQTLEKLLAKEKDND